LKPVLQFWKDAYFHRLRAEGAFLVTSKLKNRRVGFILVESEAGGRCRVRNPFIENGVSLIDLETGEETVSKGRTLEFPTRKEGRYLLKPRSKTLAEIDLSYTEFSRAPSERNWFGVKKIPRF